MAKDVITRFKLETTQYDSKIKEEAKKLSDYSKTATQAKEGFNQFTKANVDAAKALGTMATSSTNVKDRAKELVGAFNDAAKAYNSLTKEQQQSDWAQALAGSLTQLQQRIKETKQEMQGLGDSMKGGGFLSGIGNKMSGSLQVFAGNMYTKAAEAVANLGSEMYDTVKQGIELAKQGEGIRMAFERINQPGLLNNLKEATHGTVSELELMKAAIKFDNFKLPLEDLGTYLAFAQQKAKDTGESIDFLVTSIVNGLGRQSKQILDNLGISASELTRRMNEGATMTEAVAAIIKEEMAKVGDYVETAADRAAKANASLQDKMEELGRKFAPVEEASNQLWTSMKIAILDVVGGPLTRLLNRLTEAGRLKNMLDDLNGGGNGQESNTDKALRILREYSGGGRGIEGKRDLYNRQVALYSKQEEKAWREANRLREEYKALKKQQDKGQFQGAAGKIVSDKLRELEQAENRAKSWQIMRANYEAGAKQILSPGGTTGGTTTTPTTTTTNTVDPIADAAKAVSDAENSYAQAIQAAQENLAEQIITNEQYNNTVLSGQRKLAEAYFSAYQVTGNEEYLNSYREAAEHVREQQAAIDANTAAQKAAKEAAEKLAKETKEKADQLARTELTKTFSAAGMAAKITDIQKARQQSVFGSEEYNSLTANLVDATTISNLIKVAIQDGIDLAASGVDMSALWTAIASGENIDDAVWEDLVKKINEELQAKGLGNIILNSLTGEVSSDKSTKKGKKKGNPFIETDENGKETVNLSKAVNGMADGISKVVGGVEQLGIKIPDGLKNVLGGIQTVTTIISGIASTVLAISAIASADAIIPFARGGIIGRAAGGLLIPGNSMSGDRLRMPVDGGRGMIGVNSGELILNRSQQDNIASQLEGGGLGNMMLEARVSAEDLIFVLNNNGLRRGYGKYIKDY